MPQTPEEFDAEVEAHIAGLKTRIDALEEPPRRRFRETLETVGGCLLYLVFSAIPIVLLLAFFKSIRWIADVILPISAWVGVVALAVVPVFLLLAIPRRTRGWAGLGMTISSYALGFSIWMWALVVAYWMAGVFWMIVGLCFAGVGVVLVAIIAAGLRGEWLVFLQLVGGVVIVYLTRFFGAYLIDKAEPKPIEGPPMPPDFADDDIETRQI